MNKQRMLSLEQSKARAIAKAYAAKDKAYTRQYNRMKLQWELAKTGEQKDAIAIRINALVDEIQQYKNAKQ